MINLFDSSNYPDSEPEELTAGDLWAWTKSDITSTYPTALYTLSYSFYLQSATHSKRSFTAVKTGDVHTVSVASSSTSPIKAGVYKFQAVVTRDSDSEKVTVGEGLVSVLPNLAGESEDVRSHARKTLDAIQATIENTATKEQASYSIAGRSLSRRTVEELLALKREYENLVKKEEDALLRKQGKSTGSKVLFKMSGS